MNETFLGQVAEFLVSLGGVGNCLNGECKSVKLKRNPNRRYKHTVTALSILLTEPLL